MKLENVPIGFAQCPRCTGCGYGEYTPDDPDYCASCANDVIAVRRPGCRVCGGTGIRRCLIEHEHGADGTPCGNPIEKNGELCYHCDLPVEGDNGCQRGCWTPIETIADGRAVFAELGFDTEIRRND